MNKVIFYSFKIENIDFQSTGNLLTSTLFVKDDTITDLKKQLANSGYKIATDNSNKFKKIGDELYIEGMAYQGQNPDQMMIQGYFKTNL